MARDHLDHAYVALYHAAHDCARLGPAMYLELREAATELREAGEDDMADEAEAAAYGDAALPYTADSLLERVQELLDAGAAT